MGSLICSKGSAQEPAVRSAPFDVEFVLEHRKAGKKGGSITHARNTKELATSPLVNTFTKENVTNLVIYRESPQTLFENQDVSVTISNKK